MKILAIETSCDETAVAIVEGRRVLANEIYSQILLHQKWGGVVPTIAKRAHQEKIDFLINKVLRKISIDQIEAIAVTQGPGLAPALEVGIKKAKELIWRFKKKLIVINHLEGHIYSPFVQNSKGNPKIEFDFPYLVLIVSGGHTTLVIFKDHLQYQVLGETIDDAAGEALDKAAKLLGLGYPGGSVIERLSKEVNNQDFFHFPRPMLKRKTLDFSFSGLKTAFFYFLRNNKEKKNDLYSLASSFQEAVFETLIKKTELAIKKTQIRKICLVGGVSANLYLRKKMRELVRKHQGRIYFPSFRYLTGDNAAMIGVVASYKAKKGLFVSDIDKVDRLPRMSL